MCFTILQRVPFICALLTKMNVCILLFPAGESMVNQGEATISPVLVVDTMFTNLFGPRIGEHLIVIPGTGNEYHKNVHVRMHFQSPNIEYM